ncbi:hypothetical protein WJX73_004919 [Symbiochloris irregularis]|uniref:Amino acid transporter transmembrane domain-containing protein n=1 Tax=Symbiochloris irregularis TaxID=706552 RepID=A0AAW1PUJ3_9CHLO
MQRFHQLLWRQTASVMVSKAALEAAATHFALGSPGYSQPDFCSKIYRRTQTKDSGLHRHCEGMSKVGDPEAVDQSTSIDASYKVDEASSDGSGKGPALIPGSKIIDRQQPVSVGVNRGNWAQVGFHMCTSVAGPALLGLPYAMSLLGWPAGAVVLLLGFFVTMYTSYIMASLHQWDGTPHIRYRDLAQSIYGTWRGKAIVWPCQWANLIGSNISIFIQAGLSVKGLDMLSSSTGTARLSLTEWIAIMGGIAMLFTQLPTFHSLRYINGFSMLSTYTFAICSMVISLYQGYKYKDLLEGPDFGKTYQVSSPEPTKLFDILTGIVIISFAFGNTIIPECQATAKQPAENTMYKAIGVLYTLLACTYIPISFIGYWAYGSALLNNGSFLPTFQANVPSVQGTDGGPHPRWLIMWVLAQTLLNAFIGITLYNQPVLEIIETSLIYTKSRDVWNFRNWLLRTCLRCFYVFLCAFVAALFPYFGDILGVIGALGVTPIDFILPCCFHLTVRKPKGWLRWVDIAIIFVYGCVGVLGTVSSIRSIVVDASTYSVFANL